MKYRKKPVVVEAIHYSHVDERRIVSRWVVAGGGQSECYRDGEVTVKTLEGEMSAYPGDYIIKGIKGEFYPCKPDIFEATYEPVHEGES